MEGLSLEDRDAIGQTPLHYAVRAINENLVSLLLEAKSNKDAIMNIGETPLDLALELELKNAICTLVLANARVCRDWSSKLSKINCYKREGFFTQLISIIANPVDAKQNDATTDENPYKEKSVHRIGTENSVYSSSSFDIPFLEIVVPENAALPIRQVIFETVSHDQGGSCFIKV